MNTARKHTAALAGALLLPTAALSQVPDTLTSLDPGGRPMGMAGVGYLTGGDTFSSYFNPAGLGFLQRSIIGIAFRNLPSTRSLATGDFDDQDLSSEGETGGRGLSHVGFTLPWKGGGTIGFAVTLGGYVDETRTGNNLPSGTLTIRNYREEVRARTDFINVSYGRGNTEQTFNWGIGFVYALQGIRNRQIGDIFDGNTQVGLLDVDNNETGNGFGFIAGIQMTPRRQPNTSFGFSYRSEIDLDNNTNTAQLYDKIPARLSAGFATRRDGIRGGGDYIVLGAEAHHFFKANRSSLLDRGVDQTTFGVGLEYNYVAGFGRLPIRVGFQAVPSGGNNFASRNSLTFGVGYRPANSDLSVDLNFGKPERGGTDMSLTLSFKFK
jgi:hypothetical protein